MAMNQWTNLGFHYFKLVPLERKLFPHVDTSRMSWRDCHIGYTFLAIPFFLASPWFLVGMIASLNGGYASAFTIRPPGHYSRPVWWLALFASMIVFLIFTALEFSAAIEGGMKLQDIVVLLLTTKLALGQLSFLIRIRREGNILDAVNSWT